MLGTRGWDRGDWLQDYYPSDLPPEWRLAYYANDCACVLVPADRWCHTDQGVLEEALNEAGGRLLFFLEQPSGRSPDIKARLALFAASPAILLVEHPDPACSGLPQWVAQGSGLWVDIESRASLLSWTLDKMDLRELRTRAETLEASVKALVLEGSAANPGRIPELRTLLELLGKA